MPVANDGDLRIWLTKTPNSDCWKIRWLDPATGQVRQKSTKTNNRRAADRQLGELRAELLKGSYCQASRIFWDAFRRRYEDEAVPALAKKTQSKIATVLNAVEELIAPRLLADLNAQQLSQFQAKLREGRRAESTIEGYLAHMRSALKWAKDLDMLASVPKIRRPQRAKRSKMMKGRPITQEEFERMLGRVAETVGETAAPSWRHYLEGLWWSGLRLSESLELWWDDDAKLQVVKSGRDRMLRIPANLEKGNKDRLLPIAPEFAEFLCRTPEEERHGRVFQLQPQKVRGERLTADRVTRIVSKIGAAANVVVDKARNKFATAHDLRRSFGERWAELVMPQVLAELMRHESIDTTLKYYVGRNAQRTTRIVREAYEETLKKKAEQGQNRPETGLRDSLRDTPTSEPKNA